MTLVCHHPEVVSNPGRYFIVTPIWKEDDRVISIIDGTIYTTETVADSTHSFLTINITVDHFRDKSFNYSCLLQLAENGLPTGELETSGEVTVDPVGELLVYKCMQLVLIIHPHNIVCIYKYTHTYICT